MLSAARFRRTQHSSESLTHFMFGPRQWQQRLKFFKTLLRIGVAAVSLSQ